MHKKYFATFLKLGGVSTRTEKKTEEKILSIFINSLFDNVLDEM
jgi:hypothetical protein